MRHLKRRPRGVYRKHSVVGLVLVSVVACFVTTGGGPVQAQQAATAPLKVALLPFQTRERCAKPFDRRLAENAGRVIWDEPSLILTYSSFARENRHRLEGERGRVWPGGRREREPDWAAVEDFRSGIEFDGAFLAWLACPQARRTLHIRTNFQVEVYLVDLDNDKIYRDGGDFVRIDAAVRNLFSQFVQDRLAAQ